MLLLFSWRISDAPAGAARIRHLRTMVGAGR